MHIYYVNDYNSYSGNKCIRKSQTILIFNKGFHHEFVADVIHCISYSLYNIWSSEKGTYARTSLQQ